MRNNFSLKDRGFSSVELVVIFTTISILLFVFGPQLALLQNISRTREERFRVASEYTTLKVQQLESDPTKYNEILNQLRAKFSDFRVPAISEVANPKQSALEVKIGILDFRIGTLEKTLNETSNSHPSWWLLLLVIPGISAMLGRLVNPVFEYLGAHLKNKTQEILEKKH